MPGTGSFRFPIDFRPWYLGRQAIDTLPDQWEFWWEHNKAPLLDVRRRFREGVATDGAGDRVRSEWLSGGDVWGLLLPQVSSEHADVADSALLALARSFPVEAEGRLVIEACIDALDHRQSSVRHAACLSLGVLGRDAEVISSTLQALLHDTDDGRRLEGWRSGVSDLTRALAAASLGLIGNPASSDVLRNAATDPSMPMQVRAMAAHSLGLLPEGHEDIVPCLYRILRDDEETELVRAQAPIALGKLHLLHGSPEARGSRGQLVAVLREGKFARPVLDSIVIALGMLGELHDDDVLEVLQTVVRTGSDHQTRHFAIMALAQMGGRDQAPETHSAAHAKLEAFLTQQLREPKIIGLRPFASLGLGLYAQNPALSPEVVERVGSELLEAFGRWSHPSHRASAALSLGLLRYQPVRDSLASSLESLVDERARGYVVLSLSMLGAVSEEDCRGILANQNVWYQLRLQTVHALAVGGDAGVVDGLREFMHNADTMEEAFAASQAVGALMDPSGLEALTATITDSKLMPLVRGLGCVTIGIAASRDHLPWNWVFAANSNYRAKVPALAEIMDL